MTAPIFPRGALDAAEERELLGELAYSQGFKRFINAVLGPRVLAIREQLLRNAELEESSRRGYVVALAQIEGMLTDLYAATEAAELPAALQAIFR